jgi:hypothetical protein
MKNSRRSFIKKISLSGVILAGSSAWFKGTSGVLHTANESHGENYFSPSVNAKIPICLLVDDSSPLIHVYYFHKKLVDGKGPFTKDGRLLVKEVPNSFLDKFCDVVTTNKIAGKISIVPSPGGVGDIVNGIPGYDYSLIKEWLNTVNSRLSDRFDFSPEMLTHNHALDLETGKYSEENEAEWSKKQDRTVLIPYIIYCLDLLRKAGIDATGVTSPWNFGKFVEDDYREAILEAQREVYNRKLSWYFLDTLDNQPTKKPWIALKKGSYTLVSIASNMPDHFWDTIDSPKTDNEYVQSIADKYITADGKEGSLINVLNAGGWPVFVTHWQSLYSNGLETGLRALDEVGRRIQLHLGDKVEWKSCMELTKLTVGQG